MKEEQLERNLSSLQVRIRSLVAENAAFKDHLQKLGTLHHESGLLTAKQKKTLELAQAERDQLKSSLKATEVQVHV